MIHCVLSIHYIMYLLYIHHLINHYECYRFLLVPLDSILYQFATSFGETYRQKNAASILQP